MMNYRAFVSADSVMRKAVLGGQLRFDPAAVTEFALGNAQFRPTGESKRFDVMFFTENGSVIQVLVDMKPGQETGHTQHPFRLYPVCAHLEFASHGLYFLFDEEGKPRGCTKEVYDKVP